MVIYLCNYSNSKYEDSQIRLNNFEKNSKEFDGIISYKESDIRKTKFYRENKFILDQPRGAGYWLWKPYIILDAFKKINDGDSVFYIDSGDLYAPGIKKILEEKIKKNGYYLRLNYHPHKIYTKMDCFYYMDCMDKKYFESNQLEAGTVAFQKNKKNIDFLEEWLYYCKDYRVVTDSENECGMGNEYGFIDHRHDQSILTNLSIKYNMESDNDIDMLVQNNVII